MCPTLYCKKRALIAAGMSILWKSDRREKPVYMEDGVVTPLHLVVFKRKTGKIGLVPTAEDEAPWFEQILGNFELPKKEDLQAQPSSTTGVLTNLGVGPDSKKKKKPAPPVPQTEKPEVTKKVTKKGLRIHKAEPLSGADIPAANPDDPIDLESSPEPLIREPKKRKAVSPEKPAPPPKKVARARIGKKSNLDALAEKFSPEKR